MELDVKIQEKTNEASRISARWNETDVSPSDKEDIGLEDLVGSSTSRKRSDLDEQDYGRNDSDENHSDDRPSKRHKRKARAIESRTNNDFDDSGSPIRTDFVADN